MIVPWAVLLALTLQVPAASPEARSPDGLLDALESSWNRGDLAAYLSLWDFASPEARRDEAEFASAAFGSETSRLVLHRPAEIPKGIARFKVSAQISMVTEPRGRFEHCLFVVERRGDRYRIVGREPGGRIDGLVHLSIDPEGYRADGLSIRLEDFRLDMRHGTLYLSPRAVGPTVLVFVGEAEVHFTPRPPTERSQLKEYCGKPDLVDRVRRAFVRIHPADLQQTVFPSRFEPDPDAAKRLDQAQAFFEEQATRAFVLDASLPGSPWWVLPGLGDASVTFETAHEGTLTFTASAGDPESLSLFDRRKRRQICLYPSEGSPLHYSEDEGRSYDILEHSLSLRFDPDRDSIQGVDTLRIRILAPTTSLGLRLDNALHVRSVTSPGGGQHLFLRVRHQDGLLVSLGPLAGQPGELSLTIRYGGTLHTTPIDSDVLQIFEDPRAAFTHDVTLEPVNVYTNRRPWYPQGSHDDYARATLRLDVPHGYLAITGGVRTALRNQGERTVSEYRLEEPGKYMSVAVGRFQEVGTAERAGVSLRAFGVGRMTGVARDKLEQAGRILEFYRSEFGPCPYPHLQLAVVEGHTPGGHSPPGMVLLQERPIFLLPSRLRDDPANFSDVPGFFLAHELAHQWWGQGVSPENYHERWLSEGVAQYAAALWARHALGEDRFEDMLRRMQQWAFRENDSGPVSLGYRLGHLKGDPQIFRALVYDKAALVLHMLRAVVGEEAFRRALADFQERHRFEKVGTDDLRRALETAAGRDLGAYFEAWIYRTALPELRWSSSTHRSASGWTTRLAVRAENLPGPVPLRVALSLPAGNQTRQIVISPGKGTYSIETQERPRKLEINKDRGLLAKVKKM